MQNIYTVCPLISIPTPLAALIEIGSFKEWRLKEGGPISKWDYKISKACHLLFANKNNDCNRYEKTIMIWSLCIPELLGIFIISLFAYLFLKNLNVVTVILWSDF